MAGLAAVLLTSTGVWAYFTSGGSGISSASVSTLSVPGSPAATASGGGVTVTWTASTIGGTAVAATSYTVERYDGNGSDLGAVSCSPGLSCVDSPGPGTFQYKITAHYNTSWTATTGFTNSVSPATATPTATATATATSTETPTPTNTPTPAKQTPNVVTEIHNASHAVVTTITAGTSVHDKATVSGTAGTPTGTVTFTWYTASLACTGASVDAGTVTLSSGVAHPSSTETPTTVGNYSFKAHYNGDTNYTAADSGCEALNVNPAGIDWTNSLPAGATLSCNYTTITAVTCSVGNVKNSTVTGKVRLIDASHNAVTNTGAPISGVTYTLTGDASNLTPASPQSIATGSSVTPSISFTMSSGNNRTATLVATVTINGTLYKVTLTASSGG
jgi:hypothetical protein